MPKVKVCVKATETAKGKMLQQTKVKVCVRATAMAKVTKPAFAKEMVVVENKQKIRLGWYGIRLYHPFIYNYLYGSLHASID
jgi:hypothetical protein